MKVLSENNVFRKFDGVKVSVVNKIIELHFDDFSFLSCTLEHKIMSKSGYVCAKDLKIGDDVVTTDGYKTIVYKETINNKQYVYDLVNVENTHNFFANDTLTHQCLYIDELAFVQNNQADEFFTSVYPTITASKESKVILTSTPNGFNIFYKFWTEAEKGINGFTPVRVHWNETPGRDQAWYDSQRAILGELKAAQEIDAEFLGSSRQLLTPASMHKLMPSTPIKEYTGEYTGLKVYKSPVKDRFYTMTVDVSRGRHLDASSFTIFDVTEYPHRTVATYNNNEISPLMYAAVLHTMAKNYNEAYILIEINDIGAQVAEELYYTYEYENLYWTKTGDLLGRKGADPYPGIRTTKKTKRIGCANLKDIIEKDQLIIEDILQIQQLSTFVQADSGSYEADEGFHDDTVATLWLFAWLVMQTWFVDLTDKNMRNKMYLNRVKQVEDELTPFGFIETGRDETDFDNDLLRS